MDEGWDIRLCGPVLVEQNGTRLDAGLPGRQGRLLFAYLALNRTRGCPRDELIDALWPEGPPAAADSALSALLSKLRRALGDGVLTGRGELRLRLDGPVTVDIEAPSGLTPSGTVTIRNGGTVLGSGPVSGGVATITLPARSVLPGNVTLTAEYGGDANLGAGTDSLTASVSKAGSKVNADIDPNRPTKKQKVKLTVKVKGANGVEATGKVKIKVDGETMTATLDDGKLKLNLGKFGKGQHKIKVMYLGSSTVEEGEDTVTFRV